MSTYVFTYRIQEGDAGSPDAMAQWMAWFEELGAAVVDVGKPVFARSTLGNCGTGSALDLAVENANEKRKARYEALIGGFKKPLQALKERSGKSLNGFVLQGQAELQDFIDDIRKNLKELDYVRLNENVDPDADPREGEPDA